MDEVEKAPSIGISYQMELPGKRQLVLQSFVERDADVKQLNEVLDKLRVGAERQFAFGMREVLKLQLEQENKIAEDHANRLAVVDENIKRNWESGQRRGDIKLSSREQQEQRQAFAHAEECKKRIAKVKAQIEDNERIIGA